MTVTISYTAFLLTLVAGVGIAALVYLIIVLIRVNRTLTRFDAVIDGADQLLGSLKTLSDEAAVTVSAARGLIDEGHLVVADISAVSGQVRELAAGGAGQALSLVGRIKSIIAIVAGVKTAIGTVRHFMERRRQAAGE